MSLMNGSGQNVKTELRISPNLITILLVVLGIIFVLVGDSLSDHLVRSKLWIYALLFYTLSAVTWQLDIRKPQLGRWFIIVSAMMMIYLADWWLGMSGFIFLMTITVTLAAALLSLRAATVTAVSITMLLLSLSRYDNTGVNLMTLPANLIAIWITLGLMFAIYKPMYDITAWSWGHFQQAQRLLEQTRDQKAALEQTQDDLMIANRTLDLLNERLAAMRLIAEEAQKAKAAFVAKISHEFRTPLNMIIGLIDTLTETPQVYGQALPPVLLRDLDIVRRNSEHLASMINDVLALSQAAAGQLALHREWADLAPDIDRALTVVAPLLERKGLSLQVIMPDDLPQVYCDKTRIRQVILNLVSNAARYTEEGSIVVRVAQAGQNVLFSVSDTGPGISPKDAERIFEPFYQAKEGFWRDRGGSGLGLSISQQFIEHHGGRIWLESEPGIGSTFSFQLPISPLPSPMVEAKGWINEDWVFYERASWPNIPRLPYKQRFVLCDETGLLQPLLAQYSDNIEFVEASNLKQATQELQQMPAHAVIINTKSPDNLGALVERARRTAPDTPIIGCCFPPQVDRVVDAEAMDYLVKPVMQTDIQDAIQNLGSVVRRVLIVDDDPDIRQLFARMILNCDSRLEVATASSGEEALKQLRRCPPDLILLDLIMPGMDGWQVLEQKRQDEAIKDIPVIIISAEDLADQAMSSPVLLATMGQGISINQMLRCSLRLSKLLLEPEREPDRELE